ncbi:MAG: hypothetical protein NTU83_05685 [Candidatus Hydrogenedentes bacterium]|nr:hypothetical protein [Candidatus Hydrogenedentota bacterium]
MGRLTLTDSREGNVVLVGARQNSKGAVLVLPGDAGGPVQTVPLPMELTLVHSANVVEILCMQERAFGSSDLPKPSDVDES